MPFFSPPTRLEDGPVLPGKEHTLASRLRRWYRPLAAGINVYLMKDGTVIPPYTTDASGAVPGFPAWDPNDGKLNQLLQRTFFGGHVEPVNAAEQAALTAAGYGPFIT
jgi:hypothetical protein